MTPPATFTLAAIALCNTAAAAPQPPVAFESPCECRDNHGKARLAVKSDSSTPPADASRIQAVTPSDIFGWPGPDTGSIPAPRSCAGCSGSCANYGATSMLRLATSARERLTQESRICWHYFWPSPAGGPGGASLTGASGSRS